MSFALKSQCSLHIDLNLSLSLFYCNCFQVEAHKLTVSAFGHWEDVNCFNDESAQCSHAPTIQYSANLSTSVNSACSDVLTSQKVTRFDAEHFSAATPGAMSSFYSPSFDDYDFQCLENLGVGFDLPLSSPVKDVNSFIRDADSVTPSFSGDRSLAYLDHDYIQTPIFDSPEADAHGACNNLPAQRRWKILFSVFRWFWVRRIVANKGRKETC